jgi:uncharacterized protein (TIGR00251 family)
MVLTVRLTPRASRDEYVGCLADGTHRIKVRAPAVDGQANHALVEFLAHQLGVKISAIRILHGKSSRLKRLQVHGIDNLDRLEKQATS